MLTDLPSEKQSRKEFLRIRPARYVTATYFSCRRRLNSVITVQLEFSLLALRDDPLPTLQAQLNQLQLAGLQSEAAEFIVKISQENSKREQWAVGLPFHYVYNCILWADDHNTVRKQCAAA